MARPKRCRRVESKPEFILFKPKGVKVKDMGEVLLTDCEYEAIRLKDLNGLNQNDAAEKMMISQPTFHRILLSARRKIGDAIVNGKAIRIEDNTDSE